MASPREKTFWLLAIGWFGAILSTLYVARSITEFLRARGMLGPSIGLLLTGFAVATVAWSIKARFGRYSWATLLLAAVAFLLAMSQVTPIETQLHFVQYGVLGALFFGAFSSRGVRLPGLWAVLVSGACGWIDEGIQYLLPNRYYDLADVRVNALAALLAVFTLIALGWARARDAKLPEDSL